MRIPKKHLWLLFAGVIALVIVVVVAGMRHVAPSRCDAGWLSIGARCCARGQSLVNGRCSGQPARCPAGFHLARSPGSGCVSDARRLRFGGTLLRVGPNDWQSEQAPHIQAQVTAFWVDATEVNGEQWHACVEAKRCPPRDTGEPGQPVVHITPQQAQAFCAAHDGRLPTLEQRIALSAGGESRRYPWGQTGLVCRRAVFGVTHGPCAQNGTSPDVTGAHTAGQSPEGVLDLAGNVSELTMDAQGRAWSCGGSFRSNTALELKSWACSLFLRDTDDIGFRCVYDRPATGG